MRGGARRPAPARPDCRGVRGLLAMVCAAAVWFGAAPVRAEASPSRQRFVPVVVQSRRIVVNGPLPADGAPGPRTVRVGFPRPTRRGSLLVAAIVDGVEHSGMTQPGWRIAGWRRGAGMIGGQLATTGRPTTGGLQSVILFDPDNRGGVRSVAIGTIPRGTVTWVTIVLVELIGVPQHVWVAARGGSTNGPAPSDYTTSSSISTRVPLEHPPALVLTSFVNGGTAPHGERFVTPSGWRVLGADRGGNGVDQPILFDERVWTSMSKPTEWMRYLGGNPIDNCAAIVALR